MNSLITNVPITETGNLLCECLGENVIDVGIPEGSLRKLLDVVLIQKDDRYVKRNVQQNAIVLFSLKPKHNLVKCLTKSAMKIYPTDTKR